MNKPNVKKCNSCGSSQVATKKNYTHGKGSKSVSTHKCSKCSSTDIDIQEQRRFFKKRK